MERLLDDGWRELLAGERELTWCGSPDAGSSAVFPGSFNPLHEGHRRMAEIAARMLATKAAYEISVRNVDKPPLGEADIAARLSQFAEHDAVCLTRAATFVEKARLFPRATFIVGADTILRIADERYYADEATRDVTIREIAARDCRFLVFGRSTASGFLTLNDLSLPAALAALCRGVSADAFRCDISSTEQRVDLPTPTKN